MSREKQQFYRATARYHEASCRIYGADAVVHLENDNDRWFWDQVLQTFRPGRYRYVGASMTPSGHLTSGCGICLRYRRWLSRRFFVCIDSDLRHLLDRENISAAKGILQTYTYSWENHALYARKLQADYNRRRHAPPFDFAAFMRRYSDIVYEPLLLMLHSEQTHSGAYTARQFNAAITMTEQRGDEANNGRRFLARLAAQLQPARDILARQRARGLDLAAEARRYARRGLTRATAYLYVRGHCIYNALRYMGHRLIGDAFDTILARDLLLDGYDAAERLRADVALLDTMPARSRRK